MSVISMVYLTLLDTKCKDKSKERERSDVTGLILVYVAASHKDLQVILDIVDDFLSMPFPSWISLLHIS